MGVAALQFLFTKTLFAGVNCQRQTEPRIPKPKRQITFFVCICKADLESDIAIVNA